MLYTLMSDLDDSGNEDFLVTVYKIGYNYKSKKQLHLTVELFAVGIFPVNVWGNFEKEDVLC